MQALLLPVGDDVYALELAAVREVVPTPEVTPVPHAPPAVLGVINLRGDVVPVLDTATLLGLGRTASPGHLAVAETPAGPAALTADRIPSRATLGDPAGQAALAAGVARYAIGDGGVATLLDPAVLLEGLRSS